MGAHSHSGEAERPSAASSSDKHTAAMQTSPNSSDKHMAPSVHNHEHVRERHVVSSSWSQSLRQLLASCSSSLCQPTTGSRSSSSAPETTATTQHNCNKHLDRVT